MFRQSAYVCLLLAVLFAASFLGVGMAPADPGGIPHQQGEVILKFKSNASQHDKDVILSQLGGAKIKGLGRIKAELRRLGDDLTVEEAVALFKNNSKIEYIEPNYIWTAEEVPNDPMFSQLWGMENTGQTGGTPGADIHATNAWDVFTGSSSVLVGVIDTGIDYTHPDLAANVWTNPGEIPNNGIDDDMNGYVDDIHGWDFINNDNDPMDDNGHGSHCSGTIGGVGNNGIGVAGVNWHISIMGLKFLSAGGSGSTADAVEAIQYATMMGVKLTSNSWGGGGFSQAMLDAIEDANTAGVLFVAAAGNSSSNTDVSPHYPSSYPSDNIVAGGHRPQRPAGQLLQLRRDDGGHRRSRRGHPEHAPRQQLRGLQRHLDGHPARLGRPGPRVRAFPRHRPPGREEPHHELRRPDPGHGRQVRHRGAPERVPPHRGAGQHSARTGHRPGRDRRGLQLAEPPAGTRSATPCRPSTI